MGRSKLKKFADNIIAENVIQEGKPLYTNIKGKWHDTIFKNSNPIVLELGCGRGEYSTGLAELFPDKNFIGIDIKGARIWTGSQYAIENQLDNVAFLRTYIQNLEDFFEENEVSEIWLTFPDPRPKDADERRRLTFPRFLEIYRKLLKKDGLLHLKTDSEALFDYTLEVLEKQKVKNLKHTKDLYKSELNELHQGLKTRFEAMFTAKGFKINYLQFAFD